MARKKRTSKSGPSGTRPAQLKKQSKPRLTIGKSRSRRSPKTSDRDRLVTLTALTRGDSAIRHTMREIAESLGISTRTLRRVKNIPGYDLSPRTYKRIHSDLVANYRYIAPDLRKTYDLPKTSVVPAPRVFPSKSGLSRSLAFPVEGMSTEEKTAFELQLYDSGKFTYWRMKIRVPVGVSLSGRVDSAPSAVEINREGDDIFYMAGPFDFRSDRENEANIIEQIRYHEDAGREVVEIYVDEIY